MVTKDVLWKAIIEDLCEDFLHFFYPAEIDQIDFAREFEFLDKELHKLFSESEGKGRIADKLIKIYLLSGKEKYILSHIEVQGSSKKSFTKRMFTSFYRILDRFEIPIAALVILTDSTKSFHPKKYKLNFWGTKLTYKFRTYKVLDKKQEDFDKFPNNPFAIVMEAVWIELQKGKSVDKGIMKFKIAKKLLKSGFPKYKIEHLYNFIDYYIRLEKSEEKLIFEKNIEPLLKKQKPMGIMEAIETELRKHYKAKSEQDKAKMEQNKAKMEQDKVKIKAEAKEEGKAEVIMSLHESGFLAADIAKFLKLEVPYIEYVLANKDKKMN